MQRVDRQVPAIPLTVQADLLSLSRRSLYYQPVPPAPAEVAIKHAIDQIYTDQPSYGSRRIEVILARDHQLVVNRKAVQRHMREMGIAGISPGPNLSRRNREHRVYPYLLRGVTASQPNHVWAIDITYIRLAAGWMYLVAVLDLYARYIVSWALDDTLEQPFVLDAVGQALQQSTPTIWNSDQGSHFTSPQSHPTAGSGRGQNQAPRGYPMGKGGPWIISLLSGSGGRSNMKTSICGTIRPRVTCAPG